MRGGRHCREYAGGEVQVDGTRAKERTRRNIQGGAGVRSRGKQRERKTEKKVEEVFEEGCGSEGAGGDR